MRHLGAWRKSLKDGGDGKQTSAADKVHQDCQRAALKESKKQLEAAQLVVETLKSSKKEKAEASKKKQPSLEVDLAAKGVKSSSLSRKEAAMSPTDQEFASEKVKPAKTPKQILKTSSEEQTKAAAPRKRLKLDPGAGVLALRVSPTASSSSRRVPKPPATAPPEPKKLKLDASIEIQRVMSASGPEDVLNLKDGERNDDVVCQAWKRLVLLFHPDKLRNLDQKQQEAGAQALQSVHDAREEMKRRFQECSVEVPLPPVPEDTARLVGSASGSRKYEVKWRIPESQDPQRPVEKYEIWGAKYYSEDGTPFDYVLLATLPPLQTHFVLVEEAPTQQDCMWAADRVRRESLPLSVHAVNGKGSSEALVFEMPWAPCFPWLQGGASVICPRCCQLSMRRGPWSKCGGCGFSISTENALVLRCPECSGEVMWFHGGAQLSCSCCFKKLGGMQAQQQFKQPFAPVRPPLQPRPQHGSGPQSSPRWGASGGGRGAGIVQGRPRYASQRF